MKTIVLAGGQQVSIRNYVAIVMVAKHEPAMSFSRGFTGWWPVSGKEIVNQFRQGMHDRINQRGGVILRSCNLSRYDEQRREAANCAWCGGGIPKGRFNPNVKHHFCSDGCQKFFNAW